MLTEQIIIFQEGILVCRTEHDFFRGLLFCPLNRYQFQEGIFVRITDTIFSRKVCLLIEQIPISQEQLFLASDQIQIFQEAFIKNQRIDR